MSTILSDKVSSLRYEGKNYFLKIKKINGLNKHPCFTLREHSKNSDMLASHLTHACTDGYIDYRLDQVFSFCSVSHNFSRSTVSIAF